MTVAALPTDTRLPVTLLTGFLGAGKTTLLNAVLRAETGPKIAVIVNEFGEAGLDHDLIASVDEEIILMQSGCLCCSVRGDLTRTMADLIDRRQAGDIAFERVVIETTGLADPYLARNVRMDGVVTVADAATGPSAVRPQNRSPRAADQHLRSSPPALSGPSWVWSSGFSFGSDWLSQPDLTENSPMTTAPLMPSYGAS